MHHFPRRRPLFSVPPSVIFADARNAETLAIDVDAQVFPRQWMSSATMGATGVMVAVSPFRYRVVDVVLSVPDVEMIWPNARGLVAAVEHHLSVRNAPIR